MNSNKFNDFNDLFNLKYLSIRSNLIQSIKPKSFEYNILLLKLNLKNNKLKAIDINFLYGLFLIKEINLLNNSIVKIDSNAFNNSNFKQIKIYIDNISIEIMHIFNNILEPTMVKHNKYYEFYETIYIENRIDIDCEKTLWFMKNNIYYNTF